MSSNIFSGKVFLLVTGASRGIGRQIAISFGSLLQQDSHILLLARNLTDLEDVAGNISSVVTIDTVSIDLSKANKDIFEEIIMNALSAIRLNTFERIILVHNVGTMEMKLTNEMVNFDMWQKHYSINVFLPAILNAVVMKLFTSKDTKKHVINISSLFGIEPGRGMGFYCSMKAAREMYFKVFALENPDVDVLNYAPGPVDTEMFHTVCKEHVIPDEKAKFTEMLTTQTVLTAEQTVNRLLQVLQEHKYKSADHVDYYDKL